MNSEIAIEALSALANPGRSIIYQADYAGFSSLLAFLVKDCCDGRPEVCADLAHVVTSALACAAEQTLRSEGTA